MSISIICFLDLKGRKLITRNFLNEIPDDIHETFQTKIINSDHKNYEPIIFDEKTNSALCYIYHNDIIILVGTKENDSIMVVFEYIEKLIEILESYLNELNENIVNENFVLILELLEETIDDGLVQGCEIDLLKQYIKSDYKELIKHNPKLKAPENINSKVTWRKEGIYHKNNNCYVDIIETFNFTLNTNGNIIKNEVEGKIIVISNLSGMPKLELCLNEKNSMKDDSYGYNTLSVEFEDIKFHHCVDFETFEKQSKIKFIPLDGKFELMSYNYKSTLKSLFTFEVENFNKTSTYLENSLLLKANFKVGIIANELEIHIPVPSDSYNPKIKVEYGKAHYSPENEAIVWMLDIIDGDEEYLIDYHLSLPSLASENRDEFLKIPIQLKFEIPHFTVSGINIRSLKVKEESEYESDNYVRYLTKTGEYNIRMNKF